LLAEWFKSVTKTNIVSVPFKGGPLADDRRAEK
jgi:hypothetical protein